MIEAVCVCLFFFFNDTATTEIYTLSLHDALPILLAAGATGVLWARSYSAPPGGQDRVTWLDGADRYTLRSERSEEHTSEIQSRQYLVCRLLLEKKKNNM